MRILNESLEYDEDSELSNTIFEDVINIYNHLEYNYIIFNDLDNLIHYEELLNEN
jgi:hypothetical protein